MSDWKRETDKLVRMRIEVVGEDGDACRRFGIISSTLESGAREWA